jgi:hypothetical protein
MARSQEDTREWNRQYQIRYRAKNREGIQAQRAEYRTANRVQLRGGYRTANLKRLYGISDEDYARLMVQQDKRCAVCGNENSSGGRRLAVDHDHATGKIRGLLCDTCNVKMITLAFDGTGLFVKALSYLSGWSGK